MEQKVPLQKQKLLFERIAEGDALAFRELFNLFKGRLYAAALKVTKSKHAAEDIVQEVFVSLWEGRSNLNNVENPTSYIFTIAYNKSFRYLKKVAADAELYQSLRNNIKKTHNDVEEKLEAKTAQQFISQIIEKLPPRRKLIYKLSREKGLNYKQIAEQLDISPLTVKKQMAIALRSIRTGLAKMSTLLIFILLNLFS